MARSTYCYVVLDEASGWPLAAFTVKYEMFAYLERREDQHRPVIAYRLPAGGPRASRYTHVYTKEELYDD